MTTPTDKKTDKLRKQIQLSLDDIANINKALSADPSPEANDALTQSLEAAKLKLRRNVVAIGLANNPEDSKTWEWRQERRSNPQLKYRDFLRGKNDQKK